MLPQAHLVTNPALHPVMGGLLADAAKELPALFGEGGIFAFQWVQDYPYALPSLLNAFFLAVVTALVFLFLEEVRDVPTTPR